MDKSKLLSLVILSLFVILAINVVSAKTLVAGKIYTSDYSNTIENASILVQCDSNYLTTKSLSDGTYAVVFPADSCSLVNVTSDVNDSVIMKVVMFIPNDLPPIHYSGGGGGGGYSSHYYLCGNGICDSGETPETCSKDCKVEITPEVNETIDLGESEGSETSEKPQGFFPTITGAVTGVFGTPQGIIIIVMLIGLIGAMIFLRVLKKKKKTPVEEKAPTEDEISSE